MGWVGHSLKFNNKTNKLDKDKPLTDYNLELGNPKDTNRYGELPDDVDFCSAWTVAELGRDLPRVINIANKKSSRILLVLVIGKTQEGYIVSYRNQQFERLTIKKISDTFANTCGKMRIHLLENKIITSDNGEGKG